RAEKAAFDFTLGFVGELVAGAVQVTLDFGLGVAHARGDECFPETAERAGLASGLGALGLAGEIARVRGVQISHDIISYSVRSDPWRPPKFSFCWRVNNPIRAAEAVAGAHEFQACITWSHLEFFVRASRINESVAVCL